MTNIQKYLRKNKIKRKDFYNKIKHKFPVNFTLFTFFQFISDQRYPGPESAWWISKSTKRKLSVIDILYPPSRKDELDKKEKEYKNRNY